MSMLDGGSVVVMLAMALGSALPPGGSVSGVIVFEGQPPRMPFVQVDADPKCAALHTEPLQQDWLVLGEGQTVANVFVEIVDGLPEETYPVPEEAFELTQKGCMYSPHVLAVRAGQTIRILNPDPTMHNIHFLPQVNSEFNKSMPETRKEMTHVLPHPEPMFQIRCDVHSWMQAYCVVLDHPYYDVTGEDGRYEIGNLPAGTYTVRFWHERLGEQDHEITIPEDGGVELDLVLKRPGR